MKRLIVLLVVLAGGVAAAALTVPSNAATVNGSGISQQNLNSDVNAIAGSAEYQCYLNSEEYLSSEGNEQLPPVIGAGTGQYAGDHPTATSAFVANYLETEIGHELVLQLAAERHVSVTAAQEVTARANLTQQISGVMSEILQTQQGQNVRYGCSVTGQALTGTEVLSTLPSSFVDEQVQFLATATALQEDLAGVGSSAADLEAYFDAHQHPVRHGLPHGGGVLQRVGGTERRGVGRLRHPVLDGGVGHLQQRGRGPGVRRPVRPGDQAARPRPIWRAWPRVPSRRLSMTTGPTCCCRSPRARRRPTARRRPPSPTPSRWRVRRPPRRRSPRTSAGPP